MTLTAEIKNVDKLLVGYKNFVGNADRIMALAINASVSKARTAAIRKASRDWRGMGVRTFKAYTTTLRANPRNNNTALFKIDSSPIPLADFKAKQNPKRKRKRKKGESNRAGVRYTLKHGQKTLKNAWMQKSKFNSSYMVFVEDPNDPRGKIALSTITPTSMFIGAKAHLEFAEIFNDSFDVNYTRQLDRLAV